MDSFCLAVLSAERLGLPENITFFLCAGVAVYIAVMLGIGFWGSRKISNIEEYLVAGRKLPFWMAAATLLASWFGAGSSLGVASTVYSSGLKGVIADPFGAALSLLLAGFFVAGPLRKMKCLTVTDIVSRHYGRNAGIYATLWMMPVYIGWLGSLMLGMGTIINMLTGLDMCWGTLTGAAIVLIYTYAGGMWAVTLTDVVQMTLIIAGLLLLLPGTLSEAGGAAHLYNSLSSADLTLGISAFAGGKAGWDDWVYYTGSWMIMGLGCMVGQDLLQRSLAAKNEKIAVTSTLTAGVFYFFLAMIPVIIGFAARIVLPKYGITADAGSDLTNQILPRMAVIVLGKLHPVILVLFFSALISAIMSSADSCLLAGASLFCNNILKELKPEIPEKKFLLITRLSTVFLVGISLFFALSVKNIYLLMKNAWVTQLVVVFLPVMAALYLPKASARAVWSAMVTSTCVWLGFCITGAVRMEKGFVEVMNNFDKPLTCGAVYGFAAGAVVFIVRYVWEQQRAKEQG